MLIALRKAGGDMHTLLEVSKQIGSKIKKDHEDSVQRKIQAINETIKRL